MSKKKSKAVVFYSTPPFGGGGYEDAKARLKHQSLMQDYLELQKEVNGLRGTLETAQQRKLILAAEVRFLRRRHRQLTETKSSMNTTLEHLANTPPKHTKKAKEQLLHGKEANRNGLPSVLEPLKPKKKQCTGKQVANHNASPMNSQARKKMAYNNEKEATWNGSALTPKTVQVFDLKERMFGANDMARNSSCAFDLNQDSSPGANSLPRPQIFDLNQVSTGEEDFSSNGEAVKFEEVRKTLTRSINNDPQTDLKLSICRNAGEGSSRASKRKISWQDPVALRV